MEKLKAKHDHSLTDILKVLIFSLFLLIPGIMFLPSMLYFGFNHEANAPVKEVQVQENLKVDFNQQLNVRNFTQTFNGIEYIVSQGRVTANGTSTARSNLQLYVTRPSSIDSTHKCLLKGITGGTDNTQYISLVYYYNNSYVIYKTFKNETIFYFPNNVDSFQVECVGAQVSGITLDNYTFEPQIFDLTQMFGEGNEPTIAEFNALFPNSYYEYTESQEMILTVDGPTEQVVDITTQLEWNWEQIWQRPILSWTKYSILKQGLDAFTNIFGVLQTSYITNLIAYELIMVAIYIVIDIVISIFKWLTHLIGTK